MRICTALSYFKSLSAVKILVILTLIIIIPAGFMLWKNRQQPPSDTTYIPTVKTMSINKSHSSINYNYAAEVRPRQEVKLSFQVSGKINEKNVQLGSSVQAGDTILALDPQDLGLNLTSNAEQVNAAQAQLKLATSNLQRYRQLYAMEAISRAQLDQYEANYSTAVANLQQLTSQYRTAQNQLNYTRLKAPLAGTITSIEAENGQFVTPGQILVTLATTQELEVEVQIPEHRLNEFQQAKTIHVSFWAQPELLVTGKIREISPTANPASRTYQARISLLNPPASINLGMTATVQLSDIQTSTNTTQLIPRTAIYQTKDRPHVWLITNDTVSLQAITIKNFINEQAEVIGLTAGDVIVTAGVHKLIPGQKVFSNKELSQ